MIVDHGGGFQTYYAHLSKISVHAGQDVHRGEIIGPVGSSGRVTAPHLHYEVRVSGAPMNPYRSSPTRRFSAGCRKIIPFTVASSGIP